MIYHIGVESGKFSLPSLLSAMLPPSAQLLSHSSSTLPFHGRYCASKSGKGACVRSIDDLLERRPLSSAVSSRTVKRGPCASSESYVHWPPTCGNDNQVSVVHQISALPPCFSINPSDVAATHPEAESETSLPCNKTYCRRSIRLESRSEFHLFSFFSPSLSYCFSLWLSLFLCLSFSLVVVTLGVSSCLQTRGCSVK